MPLVCVILCVDGQYVGGTHFFQPRVWVVVVDRRRGGENEFCDW